MLDRNFFKNCRENLIFINSARGKIVDMDALYESMRENKVRAAGLDVLPVEPPDSKHPLIAAWKADEDWIRGRLIITPHAAFYNAESFNEMREKAAKEALRVLKGEKPRNRIV
jgi:lactate dehydrogenase-like 2-hydroxyacid dehydrogenase